MYCSCGHRSSVESCSPSVAPGPSIPPPPRSHDTLSLSPFSVSLTTSRDRLTYRRGTRAYIRLVHVLSRLRACATIDSRLFHCSSAALPCSRARGYAVRYRCARAAPSPKPSRQPKVLPPITSQPNSPSLFALTSSGSLYCNGNGHDGWPPHCAWSEHDYGLTSQLSCDGRSRTRMVIIHARRCGTLALFVEKPRKI